MPITYGKGGKKPFYSSNTEMVTFPDGVKRPVFKQEAAALKKKLSTDKFQKKFGKKSISAAIAEAKKEDASK